MENKSTLFESPIFTLPRQNRLQQNKLSSLIKKKNRISLFKMHSMLARHTIITQFELKLAHYKMDETLQQIFWKYN